MARVLSIVASLLFLTYGAAAADDSRIASSDSAEVCQPGYSRAHRVVHRQPVLGMVLDHVVPLALGGADTGGNVQAQHPDVSREKDRFERFAHAAVCRYHRAPLAEAQAWFMNDWRVAMRREMGR